MLSRRFTTVPYTHHGKRKSENVKGERPVEQFSFSLPGGLSPAAFSQRVASLLDCGQGGGEWTDAVACITQRPHPT